VSVGRGLVCAGLVAAGLTIPAAPPAYAAVEACSEVEADADDADPVRAPSAPLEELRIAEASELVARESGREPGEGIGVAVIDNGIAGSNVNVVDTFQASEFSRSPEVAYYHGTAVAGLIAGRPRPDGDGPVGIAPAASIYDIRVYDAPEPSDDGELLGLTDQGVIAGLNQVANLVAAGEPIRIVNVSLAVRDSGRLAKAIARLDELGVVVVASSGNRPDESDPLLGDFAEERPGEDAAGFVHPAGYESVVAASTSVPRNVDATEFIVPNSAIDIAAPTTDGVSYSLNGVSCLVSPDQAATSWAAAEISGVLALLMSAHPNEPPEQTVARLYRTASGAGDVTTKLTGHGVAQPVEALQRPLTFDDSGAPETSETNNTVLKAKAPRPEADVLADTRRDAVWWGLAGGGALVVALLLRPVLARRRGR
jgi:membrane-anchored mycosin MYCP